MSDLLKKYESIDQSKLNEPTIKILDRVKKITVDFTTDDAKNNKIADDVLNEIMKKNPDAVKIVKREPKAKSAPKKAHKAKGAHTAKSKHKTPSSTTPTPEPSPSGKSSENNIMAVAKSIRKEGETFKEAMERAKTVLKEKKEQVVQKKKTELEKLLDLVRTKKELQGFANSDIKRDAVREAKVKGARFVTKEGYTSNGYGTFPNKLGRKYWETRDRHSDRLAPNYPKDMPLLADGGTIWTKEKVENEITHYKNILKNIDKYPNYNKKNVEKVIAEYEEKLAKNEFADGGSLPYMTDPSFGDFQNTNMFKGGGNISNEEKLIKELRKLQRELNGTRLGTYREGDNSEEEKERRKERESKLARFNEILATLRASEAKFEDGGNVEHGKGYRTDYVYAKEFFENDGLGEDYVINGSFDAELFKTKMLERTRKPRAEGTIKLWSRNLGINPSKYIDGLIIENIEFTNDSTERAKKLFEIYKSSFELGGNIQYDLAGQTGGGSLGVTDPIMLDGFSGTSYTGLVGETGAMSSGELFMDGGAMMQNQQVINDASQPYVITEAFGNPAQHYKNGGAIKNQYEGRTAENVWKNWTEEQRSHFLLDHSELLDNDRVENNLGYSRIVQKDKSFEELTPFTKRVLEAHIEKGQYAKGGATDMSYSEWEEEVANSLANELEIDYSDAQSIIEANDFYMSQSWTKGLSPSETAKLIDEKSGHYEEGGKINYVPVSKKISQKEIQEFEQYVDTFYGKKGIYASDLEGGFSKEEIKNAVNRYLLALNQQDTYGNGDSLDRERVQEFLFDKDLVNIINPSFQNGGKLPKKNTPEWHQYQIAKDTIKNPNKSMLGGMSLEEAKIIVKKYNDGGFLDGADDNLYVSISKTKDDYWVVTSSPTTKTKAEEMANLVTPIEGEVNDVKTVGQVKAHKKVIYAKGGFVENVKFNIGDVVWDKGNKDYGVVLNNYGDPVNGESGEIRLDSDGNQSIFEYDKKTWKNTGYNLVKLGEKGDTGNFTPDVLAEMKESANRLIDSRKERDDTEMIEYYEGIYKRLLDGEFDSMVKGTSKPTKYVDHADIKTVTVNYKGKEVMFKGEDVLNGANLMADGGDLSKIAFYVPKRDVISVQLKNGDSIKPVNGYWVKKGSEPITKEPSSPKKTTASKNINKSTENKLVAPKGYVFVNSGSHRAMQQIDRGDAKYISLYSFGGANTSAGTTIMFMTENDYEKIKDIRGISPAKNYLPAKSQWFSRREDKKLDTVFRGIEQKESFGFADGGGISSYMDSPEYKELREKLDKLHFGVKSKVVTTVGLDRAVEFYDADYPIRPYQLLERAVRNGFINLDEINERVVETALETAQDSEGTEEVGSSDETYAMKEFLEEAGFKVDFVNGRLTREFANGGDVAPEEVTINKRNYDVVIIPKTLEIEVQITRADTIDQMALNIDGVTWNQERWGYTIKANNIKQFNKVLSVLGVTKRFADGGFMDGVYAKGGELQGKFLAEIKVPYNYEKVVEDEFEFTEFLSKALTKKWFGNGVWIVKIVKPLFKKDYNQKIVVEIEIPVGVTQGGGLSKFDVVEFISKTLTKKWFGNGYWGVDIIKSFADGGFMDGVYGNGGEIDDIKKAKKALIAKAKSKGVYENFGQKEVRELEDKYGYTDHVRAFDDWAMNFDLSQMADGGFMEAKNGNNYRYPNREVRVETIDEPIDLNDNVSYGSNEVVIEPINDYMDLTGDDLRARLSYTPKHRSPEKMLDVNPRMAEFVELPKTISNKHKND